ncbi:AraC family transcriptional regulator [Aquimarina megaterium]|uniref:AraC family transcriptional regulator n=1 Tax=Aquimarina megaterium TaxID=1443666 RepID=UPI00094437FA|nr:AraC family transcriptional regulator [Aquimarina megaterium]
MKSNSTILFIIFFIGYNCYSQKYNGIDSLNSLTFDELQKQLIKNFKDPTKSTLYAKIILEKAKKKKDTAQILNGYSYLSIIHKGDSIVLSYADSIIKISKEIDNIRFLGIGFLNKGGYYFKKRKFNKSLDNFLHAKPYADSFPRLSYIVDHSMGILKNRLGEHQEALDIYKKSWAYVKKRNFKKTDNNNYLITIHSLASSYNKVGKYDSATFYNKLGIKEALRSKNELKYHHFLLSEGINNFSLKNYNAAYDSITKVVTNFSHKIDTPNLIVTYYYYGKILLKKEKIDSALISFKKVDSLFSSTGDIFPEARESYEFLIDHYKAKKDHKNQLKYIERLLKVDSVLNTNYKYLSRKIIREYDTPKLIQEKESAIFELEDKNIIIKNRLLLVSILLGLSIFVLTYYYRRQKTLKKRFNELINTLPKKNIKKEINNAESIGISKDIVDHILNRLEEFENNAEFLCSGITIHELSKRFETNSKYLSKIINTYKNKNFSLYINDLRISHSVEKLKSDKRFRKYTIEATAAEVGFNTTQAFSKAFYKKTGIYPSYFIKNLEKTYCD